MERHPQQEETKHVFLGKHLFVLITKFKINIGERSRQIFYIIMFGLVLQRELIKPL